ncbi:MAG: Lrp/AsnC family transcriptional regulator [Rhizomicrobium sp.]
MAQHEAGSDEAAAAGKRMVQGTPGLDGVDLHILHALQINGRATNVQLAEYAGVTPPPALRRTHLLEERGYIRGYHAVLDAQKLGFAVLAFVSVGLKSQSDREVKAFEKRVQGWSTVRECCALSGETDFLLKCVARDLTELQAFVTRSLLTAPNVETVKTAFAVHVAKNEPTVPLAPLQDAPAPAAPRKLRLPPLPRSSAASRQSR